MIISFSLSSHEATKESTILAAGAHAYASVRVKMSPGAHTCVGVCVLLGSLPGSVVLSPCALAEQVHEGGQGFF